MSTATLPALANRPSTGTPIPSISNQSTTVNPISITSSSTSITSNHNKKQNSSECLSEYPLFTELLEKSQVYFDKQPEKDMEILNNSHFIISFSKLVLAKPTKPSHINLGTYLNPPELMLLLFYLAMKKCKIYFKPTASRDILSSLKLFITTIFMKHNKLDFRDDCRPLITLVNLISTKVRNLEINKFKQAPAFKSRIQDSNIYTTLDLKDISSKLDIVDLSFFADGSLAHSQEEINKIDEVIPDIDRESGGNWSLSDSFKTDVHISDDEDSDLDNNSNKNSIINSLSDKSERDNEEEENEDDLNEEQLKALQFSKNTNVSQHQSQASKFYLSNVTFRKKSYLFRFCNNMEVYIINAKMSVLSGPLSFTNTVKRDTVMILT